MDITCLNQEKAAAHPFPQKIYITTDITLPLAPHNERRSKSLQFSSKVTHYHSVGVLGRNPLWYPSHSIQRLRTHVLTPGGPKSDYFTPACTDSHSKSVKLISVVQLMNPKANDLPVSGQDNLGPKFDVHCTSESKPSPTLSTSGEDHTGLTANLVLTSSPDHSTIQRQQSPSNNALMSGLKTIKIERSNYRHYGHQSLMTSQSLEKIINEEKAAGARTQSENERAPSATEEALIENPHSSSSPHLRDLPPSPGISVHISQLLEMDPNVSLPYNAETINEILRLKTEQEITKRETIKCNLAATSLELLKLAKSLHISPDIIPFIFATEASAESLQSTMAKLYSDPEVLITKIELALQTINTKLTPTDRPPVPSDSASGLVLRASIRPVQSSTNSPLRSPQTLPALEQKKSSRPDEKSYSPPLASSKPLLLPLPATGYQHQQMATSHYPLYYTSPSGPGTEAKYLGSPYSQKLHPHLHLHLQHTLPPTNSAYPAPTPYVPSGHYLSQKPQQQLPQLHLQQPPQQTQVHYYLATTPPQGPQYVMQLVPMTAPYPPPALAPRPSQIHLPGCGSHVPSSSGSITNTPQHPPETEKRKLPGGGSILRFDKDTPEEEPPAKKTKLSSKSSSINFMITTPENPPAKKYNNLRS